MAQKMKNLPKTILTGVNANNSKSVLVSAVLEVHGQVRFGDGTDVGLTVTETDMVLHPDCKTQLQKFIFAGSKRRGIDRRTIHELRDQYWDGEKCYIPDLCLECPICWLYGFVGTTQNKNINAKSRVLYATSLSIEEAQLGLNVHSRNMMNEKTQAPPGAQAVHEEQVIVAGVHFPTYTALVHVLDWEIGVFAHALLENVNSNRYTAASRAQGGIKFTDHDGMPLVIVDESAQGIFPLTAPKIAGWESNWQKVSKMFQDTGDIYSLKDALEAQGFKVTVERKNEKNSADPIDAEVQKEEKQPSSSEEPSNSVLTLDESEPGIIIVKDGEHILMTRYIGAKALGYLRQKQFVAKQTLMDLKANKFQQDINPYITAISSKDGAIATTTTAATDTADTGDDSDDSSSE